MKENILDKKYPDLAGSKPVERAVKKAKKDPERKFAPHTRDERIEAYLGRLDKIVKDERGFELLKNKIIKDLAIDTEDEETVLKIAHGLYESEKRLAIEQGRGRDIMHIEQNDELTEKYKDLVKEKRDIQEKTLNSWLEYLKQNDAEYPMWFQYFVVRNLAKMGALDKEKGEYSKRTGYTIAPFPEINSEALGFAYRMLTTGIGHQEFSGEEEKEKREKLQRIIAQKDFIKLYTFAQIETAGSLNRESIKGEWVKYPQGSDHHILENTLRGKGTGWCTAEGSAYSHLEGGDFYVYFTKGKSGGYSEPRIAIRMSGDEIAEVRGVNHRQELEPVLVDIATEKYHSLPGGGKFDKKSSDMKRMTELAKKQEMNEKFNKEELIFLYEINKQIEGFGYEKDPRIAELRKGRNPKEDAPVVLDCLPEAIAWKKEDIEKDTKAYIGPLFEGVFQKGIEHLYTAFPEGKIRELEAIIGGKNPDELIKEMKNDSISIYGYAESMLKSKDFSFSKKQEKLDLVRLTVRDLGFPSGATTEQIYERAESFGLELCPAETGPHLRLQYADQPNGEYLYIGMKPIAGSGGRPVVFSVKRGGVGERWLGRSITGPSYGWRADDGFVFRLRPPKAGKQEKL